MRKFKDLTEWEKDRVRDRFGKLMKEATPIVSGFDRNGNLLPTGKFRLAGVECPVCKVVYPSERGALNCIRKHLGIPRGEIIY